MLFQIISLGIIFLIIIYVSVRFRAKEIALREFLFWSFFWMLAAAAILIPDALTLIANALGIGRGTDLAFYGSFVLIGYVLFRIIIRLDKIERDITKVVRHLALNSPRHSEHSEESSTNAGGSHTREILRSAQDDNNN